MPIVMQTRSALYQCIKEIMYHIMKSQNIIFYLILYIDDVICIQEHDNADTQFEILFSFFKFLGIGIMAISGLKVVICM